MKNMDSIDTICAVSTPAGEGGLAVIRLSGPRAFEIADKAWRGRKLSEAPSHTAHFGTITADASGTPLDEAVATLFRAPASFTGEDTVEFSCHGSRWIQREVMSRLVSLGARPAGAGEFSQRAFLNGRIDLAQAEGIADLIAASSRAAHRLAMRQVKGSFSRKLEDLRSRLVELASLLELELDFSEEDVEFADRAKLVGLAGETIALVERLADSYRAGEAFKSGVPVVIAGRPNAGKSTLLNRLLRDDRAIVSDIPGTTRDIIEDTREIGGVLFRFYDTAGLRDTSDRVEQLGIERAEAALAKAAIVLWLADPTQPGYEADLREIARRVDDYPEAGHLLLINKADLAGDGELAEVAQVVDLAADLAKVAGEAEGASGLRVLRISAKEGEGIEALEAAMVEMATQEHDPESELIVTNARHAEALRAGAEALRRAREGMESGLSADFIAQDIREALHHLGTVTGAVTTDTLLHQILVRFCIGK